MENLNLFKTVLASGMLLNPIPYIPESEAFNWLNYIFTIIAILAIIFITGTILTRKYTSYRRLTGKIFVAMGITEIPPYIYSVIYAIMVNRPYLLYNNWIFLFILGCITLAGGVVILKKVKHHWTYFLIIAAIMLIAWTFSAFFIRMY